MKPALLLLLPALLAPPAMARTTVPTLVDRLADAPIVCAHRSWLAPDRPENSLRVMRQTEARAPFMLEMDLGLTRDGSIAMMHDPTIDRTTDGDGPLAGQSDPVLRARRLRDPSGHVTTDRLPFLSDVLAWSQEDPRPLLMLDIKRTPPDQLMILVRRYQMTARVLLLTFDAATARAAFAADPTVLVSVLVRSDGDLALYRRMAGRRRFAAYLPRDRPPALFRQAHAAGAVIVSDMLNKRDALADTVDPDAVQPVAPTPGQYRQLLRTRLIDILVTNHPAELAATIGKH